MNAPIVKSKTTGEIFATASLATTHTRKDQQTSKLQQHTEWHHLNFSQRLAEIARDYLKKGSHLYIEGSLQTQQWFNRSGVDRRTTEIIVQNMVILDK